MDFFYGQDRTSQVLFDVCFSIQASEVVLLRGPSGCGKSTLLTLIGGIRAMQSGSLKILDTELRGAKGTDVQVTRRKVGFVFQAHNLHNSLTALDNVRIALEHDQTISKSDKIKLAKDMLGKVSLTHRLSHYPSQLSGGEKQRVAIARALVGQPVLILADEPTAALDGKTGYHVVSLIKKLAKEQGAAALIVTHDDRILDLADRLFSMDDGRLKISEAHIN